MLLDSYLSDQRPSLSALRALDTRLAQWRQSGQLFDQPPTPVQIGQGALGDLDYDVVISGGTLGIILGAALVKKGWRVALLERGLLQGRQQEWNISRQELSVLVDLELVTEVQLEEAIATEFNPNRIQFHGGDPFWVKDVLNIGVSPITLLEQLKQSFVQDGGRLLEHHPFTGVTVHGDGVLIQTKGQHSTLKARMFVDAMGHFSPVVAQARAGDSPDSLCMVVGTCAKGLPHMNSGDLMVSISPIQRDSQYFWEAFPAQDGRTTYLFTYSDLHPNRPNLEDLLVDYFQYLPTYQSCELDTIQIQRLMFGVFPSYRNSPLQLPWDRMLAVGDSSGHQSPLSFGGFGAMLRHLSRLTQGLDEALGADALTVKDLAWIQPYQPNLAAAWMFQQAMSPRVGQVLDPNHINQLLTAVFQTMTDLGESVLDPFLQDVVQWKGLTQTLLAMTIRYPALVPKILQQVGVSVLAQWLPHYGQLGVQTLLAHLSPGLNSGREGIMRSGKQGPVLNHLFSPQAQYRWHRQLDAWKYGTGLDGP